MICPFRKTSKAGVASIPVLIAATLLSAQTTTGPKPAAAAPRPIPQAINSISASDLKGDLSFLASDALSGRYTPSPGLEVAAEFIASQFRAAGLEPGGDQEYFQSAKMVDRNMPKPKSEITFRDGSRSFTVGAADWQVFDSDEADVLDKVPVVVFRAKDVNALKGLSLTGKAVIAPERSLNDAPAEQRMELLNKSREFDQAVASAHAKVEILVRPLRRAARARLISAPNSNDKRTPVLVVDNNDVKHWLDSPTQGSDARTVSVDVPAPDDRPVVLKNVVGIL